MKYFFISNYEFVKHRPEINQINLFEYKKKQIWSCALQQINPFIVKTYNFNEYIFLITYDEIELINPFLVDAKLGKWTDFAVRLLFFAFANSRDP